MASNKPLQLIETVAKKLTGSFSVLAERRLIEEVTRYTYALLTRSTIKSIQNANGDYLVRNIKTYLNGKERLQRSDFLTFKTFFRGYKTYPLLFGKVRLADLIAGKAEIQSEDEMLKACGKDNKFDLSAGLQTGPWPSVDDKEAEKIGVKYGINPITGQIFSSFLVFAIPYIRYLITVGRDPHNDFIFGTFATLCNIGLFNVDPIVVRGKLIRSSYLQVPAIVTSLCHLMVYETMSFPTETLNILREMVLKSVVNPYFFPQSEASAIRGYSYGSGQAITYVEHFQDLVQSDTITKRDFLYKTAQIEEQIKQLKKHQYYYAASVFEKNLSVKVTQTMNQFFTPFYTNPSLQWEIFARMPTVNEKAYRSRLPIDEILLNAMRKYAFETIDTDISEFLRYGDEAASSGSAGLGVIKFGVEKRGNKEFPLEGRSKSLAFTNMDNVIRHLSPFNRKEITDIDMISKKEGTVLRNEKLWLSYEILSDTKFVEALKTKFPRFSIKDGQLLEEQTSLWDIMYAQLTPTSLGVRNVVGKEDRLFFSTEFNSIFDIMAHKINDDLPNGYLGSISGAGTPTANELTLMALALTEMICIALDCKAWDQHMGNRSFRWHKIIALIDAYKSSPNNLLLPRGINSVDGLRMHAANLKIIDDGVYDYHGNFWGLAIHPSIYSAAITTRQCFAFIYRPRDGFTVEPPKELAPLLGKKFIGLLLRHGTQQSGAIDTLASNSLFHAAILALVRERLPTLIAASLVLGDDGLIRTTTSSKGMDKKQIESFHQQVGLELAKIYDECGQEMNPAKLGSKELAKKMVGDDNTLSKRLTNLFTTERPIDEELKVQVDTVKSRLQIYAGFGLDNSFGVNALVSYVSLISFKEYDRTTYNVFQKKWYPTSWLFTDLRIPPESLLIPSPLALDILLTTDSTPDDHKWCIAGHNFYQSYLAANTEAVDHMVLDKPTKTYISIFAGSLFKSPPEISPDFALLSKLAKERVDSLYRSLASRFAEKTAMRYYLKIAHHDLKVAQIGLTFTENETKEYTPALTYFSPATARILSMGSATSVNRQRELGVIRKAASRVHTTELSLLKRMYAAALNGTISSFIGDVQEEGLDQITARELNDLFQTVDPLVLIDALENPWGESFVSMINMRNVTPLVTVYRDGKLAADPLSKAPFVLLYLHFLNVGMKKGTLVSFSYNTTPISLFN